MIVLTLPAAASANILLSIVRNIQDNVVHHNRAGLSACAFTTKQLNQALGQIPIDQQQYTGIVGLIKGALQAHAAGACDPKPKQTQTQAAPAAATPPPAGGSTGSTGSTPAAPVPAPASAPTVAAAPAPPAVPAALLPRAGVPVAALTVTRPQAGTPAALIVLAIVTTMLALMALAVLAVRRLGLDPRWARGWHHAFAEAGWRAGGTFEDFADWLRFGR